MTPLARTLLVAWILVAVVFCLGGCATTRTSTWWNPSTWFSDRELDRHERAAADNDKAKADVLRKAQQTAHETAGHLAVADPSQAVDNAKESNGQTVVLLDQALGGLTAEEAARVRDQVALLNSQLAAERAEGERRRAADRADIVRISSAHARTQAALDAANRKIAEGFARENALANQLRNERLIKWGGIVGTVLMGALAIAWRLNLGGLQKGVGNALGMLQARYGANDSDVLAAAHEIDALTSPRQQRTLSTLAAKALAEALRSKPAS